MSASEPIPIHNQPHRNIRVGQCDGTKPFIAVADAPGSNRAVVFLFDSAGHFLRAILAKPKDPAHELYQPLTELLAELEPYAFEDTVHVRPFTCKVNGKTARLTSDEGGNVHLNRPGSVLTFNVE